jgi:hypothetical protein
MVDNRAARVARASTTSRRAPEEQTHSTQRHVPMYHPRSIPLQNSFAVLSDIIRYIRGGSGSGRTEGEEIPGPPQSTTVVREARVCWAN